MSSPVQSIEALEWFEALADEDTDGRSRKLEQLDETSPGLAAAVRDLFDADGRGGLESPFPMPEAEDRHQAAQGDRLGPYELLHVLGEGGMGTVWKARRVEGGFEQEVAIKLLRQISFDSREERRFAFEREVLGRLQHPAIARILDAGRTGTGVPYLVMEYVDGARIDEECDRRTLGIRERVRLMVEICRIVAHAHRNLVVHRDLKPANILVDPEGDPHLLDFGIAKLLAEESQRTALTLEGLSPMTLEYASPEQVQGLPVTTASDVYSLGVVLYQLLTGRTPFGRTATSRFELVRAVAEEDVAPPSSVLQAEMFETERELRHVSASRGASHVGQLRRELHGDLDNVVLKALQRDPERRYAGVDALAADLERWLRGFPVQARGNSLAYRTSKFLRRNWIAVTAACLVVLSLAVGLGVATWKAKEAREQRDRADDHAQRTEMVNQFLVNLLAAPGGRWWRDLQNKGPETRVIDVIDEAAARLEVDLAAAPLQRAALHQTLNDTYLALGLPDRAEVQVVRALEIRREELGEVHPAVAESKYYLAATLKKQDRYREAFDAYRAALDVERKLLSPSANYPHAVSEAVNTAARIGLHSEVESLAEEIADLSAVTPPDMGRYLIARQALALAEGGRLDRSWSLIERADSGSGSAESEASPLSQFVHAARAAISWFADDPEAAREIFLMQSTEIPNAALWQGHTLYDLGRYEEARRVLGSRTYLRTPETRLIEARLDFAIDRDAAACADKIQSLVDFEEATALGPTWHLADARAALGGCLLARGQAGDRRRGEQLLTAARETLDSLFDEPTPLHRRIETAYRHAELEASAQR